jgi:hypothetical protein
VNTQKLQAFSSTAHLESTLKLYTTTHSYKSRAHVKFDTPMHSLTCLALVDPTGVLSLDNGLGCLVVGLAAAPLPSKMVQCCAEVMPDS